MSLRIKEIIKDKSLTIQMVVEKMGGNRVTLSNHLNGNPSVKILQKIAVALEVNIVDLFEQSKNDDFTCPNSGAKLKASKQ